MKKTQEELWNLLDNYESYFFECELSDVRYSFSSIVYTYYIYTSKTNADCIKIETLDHEWLTEVTLD